MGSDLFKRNILPPESHPPETAEVDSAWSGGDGLGDDDLSMDSGVSFDLARRNTTIPAGVTDRYPSEALQSANTQPVPRGQHGQHTPIEAIVFSDDFATAVTAPPQKPEPELRRAPSNTALGFVDAYLHASPPPATPTLKISTVPPPQVGDSATEMHERFALGDYSGALAIAERILETNPSNADAERYAQSCREVLTQMYAARLGSLDQMVSVAVSPDQIRWLSLDHRGGFVLSLVDGMSTVEEILDISGMPRLEALRIMYTLAQQKIVVLS